MKTQPPEFPKELRHNPKYRADEMVFDALKGSDLPGIAVYYPNHDLDDIPSCFGVWGREVARWAIFAVDGEYRPVGRDWEKRTERGWREVDSPMQQTMDAAVFVQGDVQARNGFAPFMVRVLVFVDTEQTPKIEEVGQRCHVYPIWGTLCLGDDLEQAAERAGVRNPPEDYHIRKEVPPRFKPVDRDELSEFFGTRGLEPEEDTEHLSRLETLLKESDFTLVYRAEHVEQHIHIHAPAAQEQRVVDRRGRKPLLHRLTRWLKRSLTL